jgi:hypothetical protein
MEEPRHHKEERKEKDVRRGNGTDRKTEGEGRENEETDTNKKTTAQREEGNGRHPRKEGRKGNGINNKRTQETAQHLEKQEGTALRNGTPRFYFISFIICFIFCSFFSILGTDGRTPCEGRQEEGS